MTINSLRLNSINNNQMELIKAVNKNINSEENEIISNNTEIKNEDYSNITKLQGSNEINFQVKFNKNDISKTFSPFQKEILLKSLSDSQKLELLKYLPPDFNKIPIDNILKVTSNFINVDVFFKFAQQIDNKELKKILDKLPNDILNTLHKNTDNNVLNKNREDKIEDIISFSDNSGNSSPIEGSIISDIGLELIEPELKKSPEELNKKLLEHPALKDNKKLKNSVNELLSKFPTNNKDSLVYLKTILERKPPMEQNNIIECLNKLSQMVDNKNNYLPQIGGKTSFIISCLRDISTPTNISQGNIGTCNPTSITIDLAIRNPLKFLEIADTLAQGKNYDLKDQNSKILGSIKPNITFASSGNGVTDKTNRSPSSALMQNSFMDFADGTIRDFNSSDVNKDINGLWLFQAAILRNMLNSEKEDTKFQEYTTSNSSTFDKTNTANNIEVTTNGNLSKNILMNILSENKPSINNPVQISIVYSHNHLDRNSLHSVLAIDMNDKYVTIINPHGKEEKIPTNELKKRLNGVNSSNDKAKLHIYDIEQIDKLKSSEIINKINSSNILEAIKITDIPYIFNKISNIETNEKNQATDKISKFIFDNLNSFSERESEVLLKQLMIYDFPIDKIINMKMNEKEKNIEEIVKILNILDKTDESLDLINNELKDSPSIMINNLSKYSTFSINFWIDNNIEKISKENDSSTLISSLINVLYLNEAKLKSYNMSDKEINESNGEFATKINNLVNEISKNSNAKNILINSLSKLGFNTEDNKSLLFMLNSEHPNPNIGKILKNIANYLKDIINSEQSNK